MWRLWHRLFGFEYVAIRYGFDDKICRVHRSAEGDPICYLFRNTFHLTALPSQLGDKRYIATEATGTIKLWLPMTPGTVPSREAIEQAKPEGLLAARLAAGQKPRAVAS
jgi:hypothetical protein